MPNEFFVSRVPASISGPENIHFLTNLKRSLSIAEATRLRDTLTELLGDAPKAEAVSEAPVPEPEPVPAKKASWGSTKSAK